METAFFYSLFVLLLWDGEIKKEIHRKKFKEDEEAISIIDQVISYITSGFGIQEALINYDASTEIAKEIQLTVEGKPEQKKFYVKYIVLGIILKSFRRSIGQGLPALNSIRKLKKFVQNYINYKNVTKSASSQGKSQAVIMSFLPVFISVAVFFIWPELIIGALHSQIAIGLFGLGLVLEILGWFFILRIISIKSFSMNFEFSLYMLTFNSYIESGKDVISSLNSSLLESIIESKELRLELQNNIEKVNKGEKIVSKINNQYINCFWKLVDSSISSGTPICERIYDLIDNIHDSEVILLEKYKQMLPMKMLMPLFLFFLPAMFLFLAGIIVPQLLTAM